MKKSIIAGVVLLACFAASAEPEVRGSISEIAHYLNEIPKPVVVTGEAEVRVPARRAVLSLRVTTENKSLQEAMRANAEIRVKLADFLKGLGIPAERIQASKFSSTPKYGVFSEKAKGYRVDNYMRVNVQDEKEFQAATGAVDKWSEVQFDGVEFQYDDKEQQKQSAIAKACDNANDHKKIYEEKLGLKLTPAKFSEGYVGERTASLSNNANVAGYGSSRNIAYDVSAAMSSGPAQTGAAEAETAFGEIVYTARVSVEYTVQTK